MRNLDACCSFATSNDGDSYAQMGVDFLSHITGSRLFRILPSVGWRCDNRKMAFLRGLGAIRSFPRAGAASGRSPLLAARLRPRAAPRDL